MLEASRKFLIALALTAVTVPRMVSTMSISMSVVPATDRVIRTCRMLPPSSGRALRERRVPQPINAGSSGLLNDG
jgi:hypothetical protein